LKFRGKKGEERKMKEEKKKKRVKKKTKTKKPSQVAVHVLQPSPSVLERRTGEY